MNSHDDLPEPEEVLRDPAGSFWLKDALRSALARDPVDAANDAEVLARLLDRRCRKLQSESTQTSGVACATHLVEDAVHPSMEMFNAACLELSFRAETRTYNNDGRNSCRLNPKLMWRNAKSELKP